MMVSSETESTRNANQAALFSDNTVDLYFTGAHFECRDWEPVILKSSQFSLVVSGIFRY
jgi:hypothetical protein